MGSAYLAAIIPKGVSLYKELDVGRYHARPPSMYHTLTELPRSLIELSSLFAALPTLSNLPKGDRHPILLLPGFMAGDSSTLMLRRFLLYMGYEPLPWTLGRNTGSLEQFEEKLINRFYQLARTYNEKISIIGQSLGGVFARNIAHRFPDHVRQVITLGSPFGAMAASSTNQLVTALFRQQSGLSVEEMSSKISGIEAGKSPSVPSTAIFSKGDGVVNWRVCREDAGYQTESIEVSGSHCGMGFNPLIYYIVSDRLSQPEKQWRQFDRKKLQKFTYPGSFVYTLQGIFS